MTRPFLGFAIALVCLTGCGKNAAPSVSGTVTLNGQPLEKGYITFYPAKGADPVCGGDIISGEFCVLNLTPGNRRACITVIPQVQAHEKPEGVVLQFTPAHAPVTPKTAGNNKIVEIAAGAQVINFTLGNSAK